MLKVIYFKLNLSKLSTYSNPTQHLNLFKPNYSTSKPIQPKPTEHLNLSKLNLLNI